MSKKQQQNNNISCSFCSSKQDTIEFLVEGNGIYICDFCIEKAYDALSSSRDVKLLSEREILTPLQIKNKLDKYII